MRRWRASAARRDARDGSAARSAGPRARRRARVAARSRHLDYPGSPVPHPGVRMPSQGLGLAPRLRYLAARARRIDVGSVVERAKEASAQHGKWTPAVVVDMLWQAGLRNVGFQDYIDYDFAILEPRRARDVHDAPRVEPALAEVRPPRLPRTSSRTRSSSTGSSREHLHREWMVVEEGNADEVRGVHRAPGHDRHEGAGRPGRHRVCTATTRRRSRTGMPSTAACSRAASCSSKRSSCSIPISRPSARAPSTRPGSPRSSTASRPTSSRWRRSSAAARSATR